MYVYNIHIYIYVYVYIYTHIYIDMYVCMYVCKIHAYLYIHNVNYCVGHEKRRVCPEMVGYTIILTSIEKMRKM